MRADVAREITRITQEIEAAGYPRHAAQTFARLLEHEALTAHTVYGVDPVSFILQRVSVARGEQAAEGGLGQAAMYAASDGSIADFVTRVRDEGPKGKKSYYAFQVPGELEGWEVRLPSDVVLHMKSRHPEVTEQDIALVPEVLSRLDATTAVRTSTRQFGPAYVGVAEVDGKSYGISFSVAGNGVLYLNTFFRDSPEKLHTWLEQKKEAFKGRADRAEARTRDPRVTHDKPLERSLRQELEEVKAATLGQAAMYPARDADLSSFISRVREEARGEKPSYFVLTGEGIPEDAEVRVTSDLIRHQAKRHPDMTLEDNERLPTIVAGINGENTRQVGRGTYGTRFKGMQEVDGTAYAYVFDIGPNGTVSLVTFFKDSTAGIRDWYLRPEKKKKKASKVPVERVEARTNDSSLPLGKPSKRRLSDFIVEVKEMGPQLFQRAYHGTPHRFDQFTLDHMGRGEGAQVHGWGLYFAADKNVSEEYRKRLGSIKYYSGKRELGGMEARAARFLLNEAGEKRPLAEAEAEVRKYTDPGAEQDQLLTHVRELMEKDVTRKKGQLYEVNIPENDELLDEQKTLAEQAESVKEALERGADSMPDDEIEANMAEYLYQALEDGADVTGRKLYQALAQLGTVDYEETLEISSDGARAASEFLNSLGIKGITYVGHEDGRCFVIFDDKAISILNTFYQAREQLQEGGVIRGSVTLSPQEAAIRVFADKDLSTVPHEAAHIFLDDLMRIAADEGSLALATMRASLEGVLPRMGEEMRAEILAAVDAAARATPETLAEALHDAATGLRARAQDALLPKFANRLNFLQKRGNSRTASASAGGKLEHGRARRCHAKTCGGGKAHRAHRP